MENHCYSDRIQRFFACIAPVYDFFVGRSMLARARRAADLLGPVDGLDALDVCTGTGILALELAARGARVTGIDFSPAMLARARYKLNGEPVKFLLADAARMDFPDQFFDVSTISMALHEMPLQVMHRVLAEMRRVTRDRVLVMDWVKTPRKRLWQWGVSLIERLEGGCYHEFIRQDLRLTLEEAGLPTVMYEEVDAIGIFLCRPRP